MVRVRAGGSADIDDAVAVWRAADTARRGGEAVPDEHECRVRRNLRKQDAFLLLTHEGGELVGMSVGLQALADDGAGPPIRGRCHISMVFVAPDRWGVGIGGAVVDAALSEARDRGYDAAQLWTHADNSRAQRLYERRGFRRSGREKDDDLGSASCTTSERCELDFESARLRLADGPPPPN